MAPSLRASCRRVAQLGKVCGIPRWTGLSIAGGLPGRCLSDRVCWIAGFATLMPQAAFNDGAMERESACMAAGSRRDAGPARSRRDGLSGGVRLDAWR
jgi:hypothetical protein